MNDLHDNPQLPMTACYAQVFLGDCLELYKNIEPKSIDLILTDLPYGTTACKWDTIIPFDKLWEMVNWLLKPNGAFITTASQPFTSALVMSNPKMFKYEWIWDKHIPRNFINAKIMPMQKHENVLVFGKDKLIYNPQMTLRDKPVTVKNYSKKLKDSSYKLNTDGSNLKSYTYTHKNPDTIILNCWEANAGKTHPTQKPISLFEYLLKTYSNEGMTIFDPCMGSGTTGVACKNLNRSFIGIEKDEAYFKIAEQRINARTLFS